jgi:Protein of unknown function (DUF3485)
MTSISVSRSSESPLSTARPSAAKIPASPWAWMVVTCVLLGISGGIRFWRDRHFQIHAEESRTCPISLKDLPKTLGSWHAIEGSDVRLDPEVAQVAGSSDHLARTYRDEKSGELVAVLVLYGLAHQVFGHTPEVCYLAAGYHGVVGPIDRQLHMEGLIDPVRFRTAIFTKRVGGIGQYAEIYHSFLFNGQWLPEAASRYKLFRYYPGIFRILLQRDVAALSTEDSPTESLFKELVREINSRVAQSKTRSASVAAPPQVTSAAP